MAEEELPPEIERIRRKLHDFYDDMRLWGLVDTKLAEDIAREFTEAGRPLSKDEVVKGALEGFAAWQATCVGATPDISKLSGFGKLSLAIMLLRYKCSS